MGETSCFPVWIEGFSALEHGPDHGDAAPGERDEGLRVVFALPPLAVVEGLGEGVGDGDSADGALVEFFEGLVATVGAAAARALAGLALQRHAAVR